MAFPIAAPSPPPLRQVTAEPATGSGSTARFPPAPVGVGWGGGVGSASASFPSPQPAPSPPRPLGRDRGGKKTVWAGEDPGEQLLPENRSPSSDWGATPPRRGTQWAAAPPRRPAPRRLGPGGVRGGEGDARVPPAPLGRERSAGAEHAPHLEMFPYPPPPPHARAHTHGK